MLIKFLEHGQDSARKAADYLLGERDHNGDLRPEVRVLRGDPLLVAEVADSLEFKNRYSSGVIAFAPQDRPTSEQIDALLDDFEKLAFAGVGFERGSYTAILHSEPDGGVHVHILAARVELNTGKSFNVAPPGWQKTYGYLQDFYNKTYEWGDPNDPARARTLRPGKQSLIDAAALRKGLQFEPNSKQVITEFLEERVKLGMLKNRDDVVASLVEVGLEVTRQGRDYISVRDPETGSKYRLKGVLYDVSFDASKPYLGAIESRQGSFKGPVGRGAEESRRLFEEAVGRFASYNQKQYDKRAKEVARRDQLDVRSDSKVPEKFLLADASATPGDRPALPLDDSVDMAVSASRTVQRKDEPIDTEKRLKRHRSAQHERDQLWRRKQAEFVVRRLKSMKDRGVLIQDAGTIYWNIDGKQIKAIVDRGDTIEIYGKSTDAKVKLLVATAIEKGWTNINFYGSKEFQLAAAKEALKNGIEEVTGTRLSEAEVFELKKEVENERRSELAAAAARRDVANLSGLRGVHQLDSIHAEKRTDQSLLRKDASDRVRLEREPRRDDSQLLKSRRPGRKRTRSVLNDRTRSDAVKSVREIERRSRDSRKRTDEAARSIESASRGLEDASRSVSQSREQLKDRNERELVAFKSQLSIAQVAQAHGYVIDKKSTPNSMILRSSAGESIVIKKGADGVETFTAGSRGGTIVDFVQQQEKLNLGEIRKRLRPLLKQPKFDVVAEVAKVRDAETKALRAKVEEHLKKAKSGSAASSKMLEECCSVGDVDSVKRVLDHGSEISGKHFRAAIDGGNDDAARHLASRMNAPEIKAAREQLAKAEPATKSAFEDAVKRGQELRDAQIKAQLQTKKDAKYG